MGSRLDVMGNKHSITSSKLIDDFGQNDALNFNGIIQLIGVDIVQSSIDTLNFNGIIQLIDD